MTCFVPVSELSSWEHITFINKRVNEVQLFIENFISLEPKIQFILFILKLIMLASMDSVGPDDRNTSPL